MEECHICMNNHNIINIIKLDCGSKIDHNLCKECFYKLLKNNNLKCPICRRVFNNIPIYYKLKNYVYFLFIIIYNNLLVLIASLYMVYKAVFIREIIN